MNRLSLAALAAGALVATGLTATPVAAADAYGDSMTVTFGTNEHSQVPVDLVLPAPGDGRRVATVRFGWQQPEPTYQGATTGSYVVETPGCTPDADCEVHAVVPTARMTNGAISSVTVRPRDETGAGIGVTSRTLSIQNPKPTVAFTAPGNYDTFWQEDVVLAADAVPGANGVPIERVRFYVNPTGAEDDPFLEDDTAPYGVTVPASDIAESTKGGTLYAVAEDAEGNLSTWSSELPRPFTRWVRVGPPPLVAWRFPAVDGRSAGGMSTEAYLHWDTTIPSTAPPSETNPESPYLEQYEIHRDGELLVTRRYDGSATWDGFGGGKKMRTFESSLTWRASSGMTPGEHTVTLTVRTSYGSVASATRRFVVTDGVRLGRVTSGRRVVEDGYVVTAGTWVPLRFPVVGKVAGSNVRQWDVTLGGESVIGGSPGCWLARWWDCPQAVTVRADWSVPAEPGRYTLTFSGTEQHDSAATTTTRTFRVQPAAALRAGVSTTRVAAGDPVFVRGRVVRTDTGRGVRGVPVTLRWRKAGTTRWVTVAQRTTRVGGRVGVGSVRNATGFYQWVSPGLPGRLGPSRSRAIEVFVR